MLVVSVRNVFFLGCNSENSWIFQKENPPCSLESQNNDSS